MTSYASFQDISNCGQRSPSLEERISLTSTSGLLESPATPRKSWLIFTATPTLLVIGCSSNIPSTMSGKNLSEWDSSLPQSLRWCTKVGSTPVSEFTSMTQNWEKSSLSNNTICHLVILTLRQVFSLLIHVFFVVQLYKKISSLCPNDLTSKLCRSFFIVKGLQGKLEANCIWEIEITAYVNKTMSIPDIGW